MSAGVVWIDETKGQRERLERLQRAHMKARRERVLRQRRHTLYRVGERSTTHPTAGWHLYLWGVFTVSLVVLSAAIQY